MDYSVSTTESSKGKTRIGYDSNKSKKSPEKTKSDEYDSEVVTINAMAPSVIENPPSVSPSRKNPKSSKKKKRNRHKNYSKTALSSNDLSSKSSTELSSVLKSRTFYLEPVELAEVSPKENHYNDYVDDDNNASGDSNEYAEYDYEDVLTDEEMDIQRRSMTLRDKLNEILNVPSSSLIALLYSIVQLIAILLSTATYLIGTLPQNYSLTSDTNVIEVIIISLFTFDYLTKMGLTRTHRFTWILTGMNLVDFLAIIPFFIELIFTDSAKKIKSLVLLRVLRIFRIFRVLKIAKYSKDIPIISRAFKASRSGFFLSIFILAMFAVLFGSAMFYSEQTESYFDENDNLWKYNVDDQLSPFQSIPHSLWYTVITLTTVGYGDVYPRTPVGKFVGSLTMLTGIFIIAIPITILSSNFSLEFAKRSIENELNKKYENLKPKLQFQSAKKQVKIIQKLIGQYKGNIEQTQRSIDKFSVQFEDIEFQVRALRRLYRRRKQYDIQNRIL